MWRSCEGRSDPSGRFDAEAAAQLAEDGWGTVILACRTVEKADTAQRQLVDRTGTDPFATLAIGC